MAILCFWPVRGPFWASPGPEFVNWPYLGLDEELSAQSVHFYKVFGGPGSPGHELEPL